MDEAKIKLSESVVYDKLVNENLRPHIPNHIPQGIVEVLCKAWNTNPTDRSSCEQLLAAIDKQILALS